MNTKLKPTKPTRVSGDAAGVMKQTFKSGPTPRPTKAKLKMGKEIK